MYKLKLDWEQKLKFSLELLIMLKRTKRHASNRYGEKHP